MDHVTLTTTLLRVFVLHMLGLDISYWCTKFDHSSFSRFRDMVGAPPPKFKWFMSPDHTPFRDCLSSAG